jgi:hypothetical protein
MVTVSIDASNPGGRFWDHVGRRHQSAPAAFGPFLAFDGTTAITITADDADAIRRWVEQLPGRDHPLIFQEQSR